jgi:preprotein translocase subunit SecD
MEQMLKTITLLFPLLCYGMHFQTGDHPQVKFEMRLAESEPDKGLTESGIEKTSNKVYLHKEVLITNQDIVKAEVVSGYNNATFDISIVFTGEAAERLAKATAEHIGRPIALLLNGEVISAPIVRSIISGTGVISGQFTRAEAERIAKGIKSD